MNKYMNKYIVFIYKYNFNLNYGISLIAYISYIKGLNSHTGIWKEICKGSELLAKYIKVT